MFGFVIKHYKVAHFKSRSEKAAFYQFEIIAGR